MKYRNQEIDAFPPSDLPSTSHPVISFYVGVSKTSQCTVITIIAAGLCRPLRKPSSEPALLGMEPFSVAGEVEGVGVPFPSISMIFLCVASWAAVPRNLDAYSLLRKKPGLFPK